MPERRLLIHVFPTFAPGGVPLRIANVINWLGDSYRHHIISMHGDVSASVHIAPEIDYQTSGPPGRSGGLLTRLHSYRKFLKHYRPYGLLTYNWGAVEWGLANRFFQITPQIHFESGFGPEEADGQLLRRIRMRRIALRNISSLVVPSQTLVHLAANVWRLDQSKLHCIPNGVDLGRFSVAADRSLVPALPENAFVIGTVAPLRPEKNLSRLIRAFARLPNERRPCLVIVGDGAERPKLEVLANESGLRGRVIFTGHQPAPEKILGLFNLFAITSDTEQMPNAVLQAMAAGLPVAGTDVGDVKHMVADINKPFIVPKNDEKALVSSISRLARESELTKAIGQANLRHVKTHYDQETMFRAYAVRLEALAP